MGSVGSRAVNRRVQIVIGVGLLAVVAWANIANLLRVRPWDPAFRARREAAELDKKAAEGRERQAEEDAKYRAKNEAEAARAQALDDEARAEAEAKRARLDALTLEASAMTPAQRAAKVRELCSPQRCQEDDARVVAKAAKTPAERASLERPINALHAETEAKVRELYAGVMEQTFLKQGMNPRAVHAQGPGRKTFKIEAWFCTRQFVYDAQRNEFGKKLRELGFTRLECDSGTEHWVGDP